MCSFFEDLAMATFLEKISFSCKVKGKAIPVTGHEGP
jgi:hypothetical protein